MDVFKRDKPDPAAERELKALEADAGTDSPEDRAGKADQATDQAKGTLRRICETTDNFGAPWALTSEEKTLVVEGCSPLAADYMSSSGDLPKWAKWTLACLAITVVGVPRLYAAKAMIAPAGGEADEPTVTEKPETPAPAPKSSGEGGDGKGA